MTYSCTDFTDDILRALGIVVPEEELDNPQLQAELAVAEIRRLQAAALRRKNEGEQDGWWTC